jgi:hypothetical protein
MGWGCGMEDAGYRIQDTGYKMQDAGFRIQGAGCKIPVAGYWMLDAEWKILHRSVNLPTGKRA